MLQRILISLFFIAFFVPQTSAQTIEDLNDFNKERITISKKGMQVLGAWSIANIAAGAIGYTTTGAETDKNFHKMNMYWGGINLVFATVGYVGAKKEKYHLDLKKSFKNQTSIEKTFLANAALDAVYITAGLYLTERAKNQINKAAMYKGFGQSIMMQGAFLMCFDAGMYLIESKHGNRKLNHFLDQVYFGGNGIGIQFRI